MNMDEMKTIVKDQMEKRHIDSKIIDIAVSSLPHLKRWKVAAAM
jgi:hypothetical protein